MKSDNTSSLTYLWSVVSLAFLACLYSCSNSGSQSKSSQQLDSLQYNNARSSWLDSKPENTKAYINLQDSSFSMRAVMKKDHKFYGFANADTNSTPLILFSIFTSDVDGNPEALRLGSFYDTQDAEEAGIILKLESRGNSFSKFLIIGKENNAVYFENKHLIFEDIDSEEDDNTLIEAGLLESVEDVGYPLFIIHINFERQQFEKDFTINIEELSTNVNLLEQSIGKYVTLTYEIEEVNNLLEIITAENVALIGDFAAEDLASYSNTEGILIIKDTTQGDLPKSIEIEDEKGKKFVFKTYLNPEIIAKHKQRVTVYYQEEFEYKVLDIQD